MKSVKNMISLFLLVAFSLTASAMTKGTSTGPVSQSDSGSQLASLPSGSSSFAGSDVMSQLANSAALGIGRSNAGPVCYRSVKRIIAHALQKNLGCVRGVLSGGSAVNAMNDLPRAGFRNDMSSCNSPGVLRVYSGVRGGGRRLAGDTHGHIEVLGSDGNFHSFYTSPEPIDRTMPGRRILQGCFVADSNSISQSAIGRCGPGMMHDTNRGHRSRSGNRARRR